jgi:hypothetical protein
MLVVATAAHGEQRARRLDALRPGRQHFQEACVNVISKVDPGSLTR